MNEKVITIKKSLYKYLVEKSEELDRLKDIEASKAHTGSSNSKSIPTAYNTPRAAILNEAMEITHKDRNANYGNPEDNFRQIARLWNAYRGVKSTGELEFVAADVAIMCILIKVARLAKNPQHRDSTVDIAGYAACLGDIQEGMKGAEMVGFRAEQSKPPSAPLDAPF